MLRLTPIILAILYTVVMYKFSAWNLRRQLDRNSTELKDPALNELGQKMAQALNLPRIKVHVYEVDPINGLAAPDGRIFITRGFLQKYQDGAVTASELASVIAHELGHVALGHSRRRMIDFAGQNAIRLVLATVLGRFLPWIGVWIANIVSGMLVARLSRQDEYEADAYATALLIKAGIGAQPQKSLFTKLERLTGNLGAGAPAWMLSHPQAGERIAAIEANEAKWR